MENNNTEKVKKERKPRLPKLHRKFVNVQEMLQEIQEDVALALQEAKRPKQIDPKDFDFSKLSLAELIEIQAKVSTLLFAKSKEENK